MLSVFTNSLLLPQVHLGEGIMCSKYAHQVLTTVKEHSDWAVALLTGVYGDKARNMRYGKPRSPDLESFSHSFVNVAKCKMYILYSVEWCYAYFGQLFVLISNVNVDLQTITESGLKALRWGILKTASTVLPKWRI